MNSSSSIQIESVVFPPTVKPPTATDALFLGGAGERGLEIKGNFVKFTVIGVYLEEKAVPVLAGKWNGKSAKELIDSVDFYKDIVTGSFEKFAQVTMILPLTGKQYSEKVTENCVAIWKAQGTYTDAEEKAIAKFLEVFKDENFPTGSSIFFTMPSCGSLLISFSETNVVPEVANAVIDNKQLAEAILESMIGEHGVSPAAKQSLGSRLSELMNKCS